MNIVTDFLLLAASGAACFFCWALAKRIKGLTNAEEGFGAGVAALSQSAEEMKAAIETTKSSAEETSAKLEGLLTDADEKAKVLKDLISQLTDMTEDAVTEAEQARQNYIDTMTPFLAQANETADRLFEAIKQAPADAPVEPVAEDVTPETSAPAEPPEAEAEAVEEDDEFDLDAFSTPRRAGAKGA